MVGSVPFGPITARYHDLALRLGAMDDQGVTHHALSLMPPMVYWADDRIGVRLARAVNDAIAAAVKLHPDRFVGLCTLPMQSPDAALVEVERAVTELGCRGVYLGTNVRGKDLDDEAFIPVFARIEALDVPVFLHPITVVGGDRVAPYYLHNLLGNPFDTALCASRLIFGGVLDRFPMLRFCLPHAGGALPYLLGRLDRGHAVRPECRRLERAPSAYLDRFYFDTITHGTRALEFLVAVAGPDRVLLGSDYCFDMGYEDPVGVVTATSLGARERRQVLGATAASLLGIKQAP
jgi:aminocarboxymuconate-semialdehyde decarboxylase